MADGDTEPDSDLDSVQTSISDNENGESDQMAQEELALDFDEQLLGFKTFGHVTVNVLKDDISNLKVDVIVNSTATDLVLSKGGSSRALLSKASDSVQQECQTNYPNGITYGDIAVTGAGSLDCQQIYHVSLPEWKQDDILLQVLESVMEKCFTKASECHYESIAFPILGTGYLGYDRSKVIVSMFKSVEKLAVSANSITKVVFVIYPRDRATIKAFMTKMNAVTLDSRTLCSFKINNMTVTLVQGQLPMQKSDVIMTTSTRGLDLKRGALSEAVLQAAGPELQNECATKYPHGIRHGEIAVLSPGKLHCKQIYCGALPRCDKPGDSRPDEVMSRLMNVCLQQASNMKSISFPTLGTGHLKYPPKQAAKIMLTVIKEFVNCNADTSLEHVVIVILNVAANLTQHHKPFLEEFIAFKNSGPKPVSPHKAARRTTKPQHNTQAYCLAKYQKDAKTPHYWTKFGNEMSLQKWKIAQVQKETFHLQEVDQSTLQIITNLIESTWEPSKVGKGRDARGLKAFGTYKLKVNKVQRIENLNVFEKYSNKKKELFHKAAEGTLFKQLSDIVGCKDGNSKVDKLLNTEWKRRLHSAVNEGYFFHGTKPDKVEALSKQGLDPRMSFGESVFGQAIYMAESSTKADQYTDHRSKERSKTDLQMFLVRACLGNICLMKHVKKLKRPPCAESDCQKDDCAHDNRYDSIVEEEKFIFREFVAYESSQVYPEYIITYDRV